MPAAMWPGALPLRVRCKHVVFFRHDRMAREPAIGAASIGLERIGRGVIVKLGVSPVAAFWKSLAIPDHEIDVMQGVWYRRRSGGLGTLFCFPMDLRHLRAVRERLAVAGNAGLVGVDHHGVDEDHSEHVSGLTDRDRLPLFVSPELGE